MSNAHPRAAGDRGRALIDAYLADLRRTLDHENPDDADDIEQSIREHIDSALASIESPTVKQIQTILDELGPIEGIAYPQAGNTDPPPNRTAPVAIAALVAISIVATILTGFWFISGPLGLIALVIGLLASQHTTGQNRTTYRVVAAVGAVAVVLALIVALFLTSTTSG